MHKELFSKDSMEGTDMKQKTPLSDEGIVRLYWERSESAITYTDQKYGGYCRHIARNILFNESDTEECVNDTYLDAWESMPPHRPTVLSTFLGKITRRIAIDRIRYANAEKRGGGELPLVLDELADCVADMSDVEAEIEEREGIRLIRDFLLALPSTERRVFLCRYWYMDTVSSISSAFGFSEGKTTSMLHRTRIKLRRFLESEGYL
jgi:RNA polymerase sigma-70 factor (ECF subfamily)